MLCALCSHLSWCRTSTLDHCATLTFACWRCRYYDLSSVGETLVLIVQYSKEINLPQKVFGVLPAAKMSLIACPPFTSAIRRTTRSYLCCGDNVVNMVKIFIRGSCTRSEEYVVLTDVGLLKGPSGGYCTLISASLFNSQSLMPTLERILRIPCRFRFCDPTATSPLGAGSEFRSPV